MKILLVGGSSSLAKALKPKLLSFCKVLTAGRNNCDITIDLADCAKKYVLPKNIDFVINTAGSFGGKSFDKIYDAENVNVLGNLSLCEASINAGVKHYIYISSIFSEITENSDHYNIYSISKKHSEDIIKYYCKSNNLPLCILKPSQIYGVSEIFRKHQPFFYSILDNVMNNKDVNLYGTNDPLRNYIYIDDLTDILIKVIQQNIVGVYPCTSMKNVTYSEIANIAFKTFNTQGVINFIENKPNVSNNIFNIDESLYKKINYYPQVSIEEGIKKIALSKKQQ